MKLFSSRTLKINYFSLEDIIFQLLKTCIYIECEFRFFPNFPISVTVLLHEKNYHHKKQKSSFETKPINGGKWNFSAWLNIDFAGFCFSQPETEMMFLSCVELWVNFQVKFTFRVFLVSFENYFYASTLELFYWFFPL